MRAYPVQQPPIFLTTTMASLTTAPPWRPTKRPESRTNRCSRKRRTIWRPTAYYSHTLAARRPAWLTSISPGPWVSLAATHWINPTLAINPTTDLVSKRHFPTVVVAVVVFFAVVVLVVVVVVVVDVVERLNDENENVPLMGWHSNGVGYAGVYMEQVV